VGRRNEYLYVSVILDNNNVLYRVFGDNAVKNPVVQPGFEVGGKAGQDV